MNRVCLLEKNARFVWSDNWWFDNGEAWFVAGDMNILFFMKGNEAYYVSQIPSETVFEFRKNPRCIKNGDVIFCFPDEGEYIWCYHLNNNSWTSICVENPKKIRLLCSNIFFVQNKFYIVSIGLKKVIEVDVLALKIDMYYDLQAKEISGAVLVNDYIYIVDSHSTAIYKFNCVDKTINKQTLVQLDDHIKTISFDGDKFWMSGNKKKIYIWEEKLNKVRALEDFPKDFGIYNFSGEGRVLLNKEDSMFEVPMFLYSVFVDQYIWFIPFQTNEILYVNKDIQKIEKFALDNEEHTDENVKTQMLGHKYILEYVKENRFIGIYSLKNKWIVEIDAKELTYRILDCKLSDDSFSRILSPLFQHDRILREADKWDLEYLLKYLQIEK